MSKKIRTPPQSFQTPSGSWHEPHIVLFSKLVHSASWRQLSHGARDLYIVLLFQYKGAYTGEAVKCPYTDIIPFGFSRAHIGKYIGELEKAGLIETEHGGTSRIPNVYHFSDRWVDKEYNR